jgi:hypothetical protein
MSHNPRRLYARPGGSSSGGGRHTLTLTQRSRGRRLFPIPTPAPLSPPRPRARARPRTSPPSYRTAATGSASPPTLRAAPLFVSAVQAGQQPPTAPAGTEQRNEVAVTREESSRGSVSFHRWAFSSGDGDADDARARRTPSTTESDGAPDEHQQVGAAAADGGSGGGADGRGACDDGGGGGDGDTTQAQLSESSSFRQRKSSFIAKGERAAQARIHLVQAQQMFEQTEGGGRTAGLEEQAEKLEQVQALARQALQLDRRLVAARTLSAQVENLQEAR